MNKVCETSWRPGPAFAVAALAALVSMSAWSEVYVHTGEHGEASFTDQPVPGAEPVALDPVEPPANAAELSERRIRQALEVARALEASRLARDEARADARAAAARAASARAAAEALPVPQVVYQDRYVSNPYLFGATFGQRFHGRGRFHGRDGFHGGDRFHHRDRFRPPFDGFPNGRHHRPTGQRTISKEFLYEPD